MRAFASRILPVNSERKKMFSKECRDDDNLRKYVSNFKEFDFDTSINNEVISRCYDGNIIIWCDASINKNKRHDQYSLHQLRLVNDSTVTFTNEKTCLGFINEVPVKNKIFLIVSGSVGKNFVPKVSHLSHIYSIYIFCGKKSNHETWAKEYEKIKGVFDKITELCQRLKSDQQILEQIRLLPKIMDEFSKQVLPSCIPGDLTDLKNSKHGDHHQQPKDDIKLSVPSADAPFSNKEEPCAPTMTVEISNNICSSGTVVPYTQYKQQMEFSDTGIWPCVIVIDSTRNGLLNQLPSIIECVKHLNSVDDFLQHIHHHPIDPHLVILSNPINLEHLSLIIRPRVRRVYIYCSNNRLNEYDAWSKRYSDMVSVLQHVDTLTRLILWDLSACIVDIGNYYDGDNKTNLAQTRYRYAYRLHVIIQGDLNNRIEMIECTQPRIFNN